MSKLQAIFTFWDVSFRFRGPQDDISGGIWELDVSARAAPPQKAIAVSGQVVSFEIWTSLTCSCSLIHTYFPCLADTNRHQFSGGAFRKPRIIHLLWRPLVAAAVIAFTAIVYPYRIPIGKKKAAFRAQMVSENLCESGWPYWTWCTVLIHCRFLCVLATDSIKKVIIIFSIFVNHQRPFLGNGGSLLRIRACWLPLFRFIIAKTRIYFSILCRWMLSGRQEWYIGLPSQSHQRGS